MLAVRVSGMSLIPGRKPLHPSTQVEWRELGVRTRLAAARRRRYVRQQDLAAAVGVSVATLREIEAGRVGDRVPIGTLLACAAALDLPFSALIEDEWLEKAEQIKPAIDHGQRLAVRDAEITLPPP